MVRWVTWLHDRRWLAVAVGIIVTSKKRQDLRVQLQKRARRRAEKKVEYLEDDKNWKEVRIAVYGYSSSQSNLPHSNGNSHAM